MADMLADVLRCVTDNPLEVNLPPDQTALIDLHANAVVWLVKEAQGWFELHKVVIRDGEVKHRSVRFSSGQAATLAGVLSRWAHGQQGPQA